uniref:Uncharacterized protein n=1 Tax=Cacopsylla melanoneura TaxID=428564 RepID=A0A8D8XAX8_9HEMI
MVIAFHGSRIRYSVSALYDVGSFILSYGPFFIIPTYNNMYTIMGLKNSECWLTDLVYAIMLWKQTKFLGTQFVSRNKNWIRREQIYNNITEVCNYRTEHKYTKHQIISLTAINRSR